MPSREQCQNRFEHCRGTKEETAAAANIQIKSEKLTPCRVYFQHMHITSQSFVQSYRRFEQNCYVHTFSTSEHTSGIGFPRYSEHSYFCQAS